MLRPSPQYSAPFSPEESQGPPVDTAVHQEPLIHSQFCGDALPVENVILQHPVNESYLNVLTTQFNSNVFVPAMLFGSVSFVFLNERVLNPELLIQPIEFVENQSGDNAQRCSAIVKHDNMHRGRDSAVMRHSHTCSSLLCEAARQSGTIRPGQLLIQALVCHTRSRAYNPKSSFILLIFLTDKLILCRISPLYKSFGTVLPSYAYTPP